MGKVPLDMQGNLTQQEYLYDGWGEMTDCA